MITDWGAMVIADNAWTEYPRPLLRRAKGIAAGIYTQTTDVEGEVNGLMTYDRKVVKIPKTELAELHKMPFVETS